jgi:hypothetical protein
MMPRPAMMTLMPSWPKLQQKMRPPPPQNQMTVSLKGQPLPRRPTTEDSDAVEDVADAETEIAAEAPVTEEEVEAEAAAVADRCRPGAE